ncbi:MAG: phosphopantothenoylcysteine decarboxylase [Thermoguttaceae bacterium]|nr:phosphopantothenoylcysteine decarboxylase [Thermoguttaceae bacterium]
MLKNHEILIGVSGGIAAFKTAVLVSQLVQSGAGVSVIMTESATHLVCPRTFEALTGRPVRVSMWDSSLAHPHIDLARKAELFCIVPATANILAKTACGIADDLLSTTYLAFDGPVFMVPAMNTVMWNQKVVQRNVQQLIQDGVQMIGPEKGHLSCGQQGLGRMSEPEKIFEILQNCFKAQ